MNALIVDDEAPARARLRRLLSAFADVKIVGEASNGIEALERNATLSPDVIFLDIEMPHLDGLGVARSLGLSGPAVVFVTAYDEFALKAFDAHAVDYLVKPVSEKRLSVTLEKLRARHSKADRSKFAGMFGELGGRGLERIAVKTGNRYVVVDLKRACAIVAKDHYSAILVDGRELLADESLDELEGKLDPSRFVRVHRGAIVNLEFIKELEREGDRKFTAILGDAAKTRVQISRERLDEVKKKIGF